MSDFSFEIDPRVVFDLGESLVSDETTALVELVKNAYDADASKVTITIERDADPPEASAFSDGHGYIAINDDGTGMDDDDIRHGWLTVARSPKRAAKSEGRSSPLYGRVALGDKGLGRLGAQRLGEHLELFTSKTVVSPHAQEDGSTNMRLEPHGGRTYVAIDWRDFLSRETLSAVPIVHQVVGPYERGTRVLITGLRDRDVWSSDVLPELQERLGQFISPFREVATFRVHGRLNGQSFDLVDVSESVLALANQRVFFSYADGHLEVSIDYRPTFVRSPRDHGDWGRFVAADQGAAFGSWLVKSKASGTTAQADAPDGWFLRLQSTQNTDWLGGLATKPGTFVDPGPFHGEIHSFDLSADSRREAQLSDYSRLVRSLSGVRVYRDGFAIRPYGIAGDDWLKLGSQWTSGASYYGLKPGNTVGFVAISAGQNAQLQEKTDREGFTDSPASKNFELLMRRVVQLANDSNERVRRAYLDYLKEHHSAELGGERIQVPGDALAEVRRAAAEARSVQASTRPLAVSLAAARDTLAPSAGQSAPAAAARLEALERVIGEADRLIASVDLYVQRVDRLGTLADVLERDLDKLGEQVDDFAELAALGLTVESVAHELRNVTDALSQRTRDLSGRLKSTGGADPQVVAYLEHVRSAMSAVRKQLSHLSPALRYVREERQTFGLSAFVDDFVEFHRGRLARRSINLLVDKPFAESRVRMNKGRLTQVLDNLVQNSEYWLREDLAAQRIQAAEIHLQSVGAGRLRVWDTGRGFDPAIEDSVFEPFVTNKPPGTGRGLGLFIVRQLLRAAGATIELLQDRNAQGGRYVLEVDLGGAIVARDG